MNNESEYKGDFDDFKAWNNDLMTRLIPHSSYNCVGYYNEIPNRFEQENNEGLSNCDIIEILTEISINVGIFQEFIRKTGYRVLDSIYGPDYFHFFITKVE
jgi:hypothetical protein